MLDRHHTRLRRAVAGILPSSDRVDDVLQEAYLKAYRRLPRRFANEAHEATWLYRVVYRCCLDELRRGRRRRETPVAEVHGVQPPRLDVESSLRVLNPADRAVLLLVDLLDFRYEEVAAILSYCRISPVGFANSGGSAQLHPSDLPPQHLQLVTKHHVPGAGSVPDVGT
jgi:DNA-directed RNA polymerase specialized sigma24 family protein